MTSVCFLKGKHTWVQQFLLLKNASSVGETCVGVVCYSVVISNNWELPTYPLAGDYN